MLSPFFLNTHISISSIETYHNRFSFFCFCFSLTGEKIWNSDTILVRTAKQQMQYYATLIKVYICSRELHYHAILGKHKHKPALKQFPKWIALTLIVWVFHIYIFSIFFTGIFSVLSLSILFSISDPTKRSPSIQAIQFLIKVYTADKPIKVSNT